MSIFKRVISGNATRGRFEPAGQPVACGKSVRTEPPCGKLVSFREADIVCGIRRGVDASAKGPWI